MVIDKQPIQTVSFIEAISNMKARSASPARPQAPTARKRRAQAQAHRVIRQGRSQERDAVASSALPEPTWRAVRQAFVNSRSLGEIALATVAFFDEQWRCRAKSSPDASQAIIPAGEISRMLRDGVPRKRRIYDVLHVLEGTGMLKRARCGPNAKRGNHYLYYGFDGAIQRLAQLKSESTRVVQRLQGEKTLEADRMEDDRALVATYEDQGAQKKWASLTTVTTCLLGLLLREESGVPVSLAILSQRLTQGKRIGGAASDDVNRRVYDIVSILASCGLVATLDVCQSTEATSYRRKHVRFNFALFAKSELAPSQQTTGSTSRSCEGSTQPHWDSAGPLAISNTASGSPKKRQSKTLDGSWGDAFKSTMCLGDVMVDERIANDSQQRIEQDWAESWGFTVLSYQIHQDFLHNDMGISATATTASIGFQSHEPVSQ